MRVRPRFTSSSRVISDPARPLALSAIELLVLRAPDEREHVAARAGHHRLDDREHRGRRHRGVDRVAAVLHHFDGGARGERLTRRGDAVRGVDGGASGHCQRALRLCVRRENQNRGRADDAEKRTRRREGHRIWSPAVCLKSRGAGTADNDIALRAEERGCCPPTAEPMLRRRARRDRRACQRRAARRRRRQRRRRASRRSP